jgi:serine protease Do
MNTTDQMRENTSSNHPRRFSPSSAILGVLAGLGIAGAFWAGHEYWPSHSVVSTAPMPLTTSGGSASLNSRAPVNPDSKNFIADIVAEAAPSVVNIDTSTSLNIGGVVSLRPFGMDTPLWGEEGPPIQKYESHGAGSGFIIREDGYILTNNHVIQNADDIKVTLNDGRVFKGRVVGKDKYSDLALVKIDANRLVPAKLGESTSLRPGDWAIAIGSPLGLSKSVTLGIISALGRSLGELSSIDLIQTDAAINPGNSGGPLLNIKGEVVGINQAIRRDGQNISFAIPVDVAKSVVSQLLQTGTIHHAYLGIGMVDMDPNIAKTIGVSPDTKGVAVARVDANSPAYKAGLLPRDIIQRINDKSVNSSKEVQTLVRAQKPGEKLDMWLLRQTEAVHIPVKIGDYEQMKKEDDNTDND